MSAFIAIDWGTTNRRIYRIENGIAVHSENDSCGVVAMAGSGYADVLAEIRSSHGELPVLMAGMVGSTIGWQDTSYCTLPAGLDTLSNALYRIDENTAIVPGLAHHDGLCSDVMRGEEVQLLGAVKAGLVPNKALLCQPGTHCKWVTIEGGRIVRFATSVSGELFALVRSHSVIGRDMTHPASPGVAFAQGVAEGSQRDLAASLFRVRAAGVLDHLAPENAASYASGILIGAEIAPRLDQDRTTYVLAGPDLGGLYCDAISQLGGRAERIDSHHAFVAGISAIREMSI